MLGLRLTTSVPIVLQRNFVIYSFLTLTRHSHTAVREGIRNLKLAKEFCIWFYIVWVNIYSLADVCPFLADLVWIIQSKSIIDYIIIFTMTLFFCSDYFKILSSLCIITYKYWPGISRMSLLRVISIYIRWYSRLYKLPQFQR